MAHYDNTQENRRNLLLIACSQRKRVNPELLSALERYEGNTYRMIRKLKREEQFPRSVDGDSVETLDQPFYFIASGQQECKIV